MVTRTSRLLIAAAAASTLCACTALDRDAYNRALEAGSAPMDTGTGTDIVVDTGSDIADAGTDIVDVRPDVVADVTIPDAPLACDPFRVPSRPPTLGDVPGTRPPLFFVMQRVQFGLATRSLWGQHGFDRDGLCSDPAIPGTMGGIPCRPRLGTATILDGERGRDNAFAAALGFSLAATNFDESRANNSAATGNSSIGVRISDYGGTDDGNVTVDWFPLTHGHRPGAPASPPLFDGNDVWHINSAVAYDADHSGRAAVRSEDAFVNSGQLVIRLIRGSPIRLASATNFVRLTITGGRLVGALAPDGSSFGPTEFSGIWPLAEAFSDVATLGICPPPPAERAMTWNFVSSALNNAADLHVTEEVAPATQCDAISMGFGVEWVRATLDPTDESSGPINENPCLVDGGHD